MVAASPTDHASSAVPTAAQSTKTREKHEEHNKNKERKRSRAKRTQRVPPRILAHHRCSPDDRQRLRTGLCFRCAAAPPASPPSVFSHHWVSCGAAQKVKAAKGPESEASSTQHTLRKKQRENIFRKQVRRSGHGSGPSNGATCGSATKKGRKALARRGCVARRSVDDA